MFRVSPLQKAHENTNRRKKAPGKRKPALEFGMNSNTLIQWLTDVLPDADNSGLATTLDLVGTWAVINRGKPSQGQLLFSSRRAVGIMERRGPTTLGSAGLGSLGFTCEYIRSLCPLHSCPFETSTGNKAAKENGWALSSR